MSNMLTSPTEQSAVWRSKIKKLHTINFWLWFVALATVPARNYVAGELLIPLTIASAVLLTVAVISYQFVFTNETKIILAERAQQVASGRITKQVADMFARGRVLHRIGMGLLVPGTLGVIALSTGLMFVMPTLGISMLVVLTIPSGLLLMYLAMRLRRRAETEAGDRANMSAAQQAHHNADIARTVSFSLGFAALVVVMPLSYIAMLPALVAFIFFFIAVGIRSSARRLEKKEQSAGETLAVTEH